MTKRPLNAALAAQAVEAGRRTLALESAALSRMAGALGEDFARAVDLIAALKGRLICTGMGKSGHVAGKIAATLASTGQPASFVHPGEASSPIRAASTVRSSPSPPTSRARWVRPPI